MTETCAKCGKDCYNKAWCPNCQRCWDCMEDKCKKFTSQNHNSESEDYERGWSEGYEAGMDEGMEVTQND